MTFPSLTAWIHLNHYSITEPYTQIVGSPDIFLEEGATMNLTCLVKDSPEPPQYIFWYHNQQPISYSSIRGGISQVTEKGEVTASFLLIQQARLADSGQYDCHASVGNISTVTVHVIKSKSVIMNLKYLHTGESLSQRHSVAVLQCSVTVIQCHSVTVTQ